MSASAAGAVRQQRPSVIGSDVRRFWALAFTLAATDFKLRFYGSVLGYVWTLARPFLYFGVIYFVFTEIAGLDADVKNYGVYILFGLVLFTFFTEATSQCVSSLAARENLLRKMRFPRLVIPISVVLTALFNLGMTLIAVLVFTLANGIYPTWSWLELPVLVSLLAILATGVGMLLSALYIRYRDVQPIWEVLSQALFYASPVLYVSTLVPDNFQRPYSANPIASILAEVRHAVVDPTAPSAAATIGGAPRLLIPLALVFAMFALGLYVFTRQAPKFAENL